jgi:hypothetical protein
VRNLKIHSDNLYHSAVTETSQLLSAYGEVEFEAIMDYFTGPPHANGGLEQSDRMHAQQRDTTRSTQTHPNSSRPLHQKRLGALAWNSCVELSLFGAYWHQS